MSDPYMSDCLFDYRKGVPPAGHRCVDDCRNGSHVVCEHTQRQTDPAVAVLQEKT
jgi:hypothetical protein